MTDWPAFYREHVDALGHLAPRLTEEQLRTTVPATPRWSVLDVLRHLAGVAADNVSGRTDGAPGEAWTARQVAERADRTPAELVAELRGHLDAVSALLEDAGRPALAWDVAVHHADLHEALGLGRPPERLWAPVTEAVLPSLPVQVAHLDPYELFRAAFSRRSREQMAAWGTDAERADLDAMCVFGPRDDAQPVPT